MLAVDLPVQLAGGGVLFRLTLDLPLPPSWAAVLRFRRSASAPSPRALRGLRQAQAKGGDLS